MNNLLRRPTVLKAAMLWIAMAPGLVTAQEMPSRFVDEQTAAVVRFDLDRIDVNAAAKWLAETTGGARVDARAGVPGGQQFVDAALQGLEKAGAKQVFLVVSLADAPFRGAAPGFFVVPLPKDNGGDARAIANVLTTGGAAGGKGEAIAGAGGAGGADWTAETIDDAVVAGTSATLKRLRAAQPAAREDLAKVLAGEGEGKGAGAAAGGAERAAIVAAIAPTDDMRKVVEEMLPALPAEIGGGSAGTLTRGARWARLAVSLPPDGSLRLVVQSQDAAAAKAMSDLLGRVLKLVSGLPELRRAAGADAMDRLARVAEPKVERDRVVIFIDRTGLNDVVPPLAAAMRTARRRAAVSQSANQVRQLLLGCIMYADVHQGQFPDTLEQAAKTAAGGNDAMAAALLRNPRGAARYEYLKPKLSITALPSVSDTLLVYEKGEKWDPPAVLGFADGHVITVKDEAELQKHMEAAGKAE